MTLLPSDKEEQRLQGRHRFIGFAFAGGDLLIETDLEGEIGYVAGAAKTMTGRVEQELIGQKLVDLVLPGVRERVRAFMETITSQKRALPCRVAFEGVGGHWIQLSGYCSDMLPDSLLLSLRIDFTDQSGQPAIADAEAFKTHLIDKLEAEGKDSTLTMLDLSDLENWSDEAAASCRREIGACLVGFGDGTSSTGWLADDVLGIVQDCAFDIEALEETVRTHSKVMDPEGIGLEPKSASLSMDGTGLKSNDASQALLYAINRFAETKGDGFSIRSLTDGFDSMVKEIVEHVVEVRDTVNNDDVELNYQPIVDLKTRWVHHYEVLSRLKDGQSPFALVSFAEQVGLIADFDLMVCRRVMAMFNRDDYDNPPNLAVNLSARSMESEAFGRALMMLVSRHPGVRGRLMFELTESAAISYPDPVAHLISRLRKASIKVCLDDFGSGAAAFHYVRAFPFDYVKIDGMYIRSTERRDQAILRGMASLCHELGVKSVAEMVETPVQAERLAKLGIDLGQGYLFGRPSPSFR